MSKTLLGPHARQSSWINFTSDFQSLMYFQVHHAEAHFLGDSCWRLRQKHRSKDCPHMMSRVYIFHIDKCICKKKNSCMCIINTNWMAFYFKFILTFFLDKKYWYHWYWTMPHYYLLNVVELRRFNRITSSRIYTNAKRSPWSTMKTFLSYMLMCDIIHNVFLTL